MRRRPATYELPHGRRGDHSGILLYHERPKRTSRLLVLGVVIIAGLILSLFFPYGPRVSLPYVGSRSSVRLPVVRGLATSGSRHGTLFDVSAPISLSWDASPRASAYRLQVAHLNTGLPLARSFAHTLATLTLSRTLYYLHLDGPGIYVWRVRARVDGHWGPFATAHPFTAGLALARPIVLSPHSHAYVLSPVTLCWSPVANATGFVLQVAHRRIASRATCARISLHPGVYAWRVAAISGPFSATHRFTVRVVSRRTTKKPARTVRSAQPRPAQQGAVTPSTAPPISAPASVPAPNPAAGPVQQPVVKVYPTAIPVRVSAPTSAPVVVTHSAPAPQPAPTAIPSNSGQKSCIPMFTC